MKNVMLLIIAFFFVFNADVISQCKFKKIKKYTKVAISDDCDVQVDISTKLTVCFSKFSTKGTASFVKSGEDYYLFFLLYRSYSSKFELLKSNPLVLNFNDGESVRVYPCGDFHGKRPITSLTDYLIGCFYNISEEQVKKISLNTISSVFIYFTANKQISESMVDNEGGTFMEYEVNSETYSQNIPESAMCILSK